MATNCELHVVGKMGFEINDTNVKRAGLDYWPHLKWYRHETFQEWLRHVKEPSRMWLFTTKTQKSYFQAEFQAGDWLVFGKETKGLPPEFLQTYPQQNITIPMVGEGARSLNLATSVAIAAYEGFRQLNIGPVGN